MHSEMTDPEYILLQLELGRAALYARDGNYVQAELLLSHLIQNHGESISVLDLHARVLSQQGKLSEAEALWKRALEHEPDNVGFRKALERIYEIRRRTAKWRFRYRWMGRLFVIASSIVAFGVLMGLLMNVFESASTYQDVRIQQTTILDRLDSINGVIHAFQISKSAIQAPQIEISVPGTRTYIERNELVVVFEEGLFVEGNTLKPEALDILTNVGRSLEPHLRNIQIFIFGCTDNVPVAVEKGYSDNYALGLARASAVISHFRSTTTLLPSQTFAGSYGEYLPVFSNDTVEGRLKNRTAIIRIRNVG